MKYILAFLFFVLTMPTAKAEVFVWQDPVHDIELTFPHEWVRQAQEGPDLRLHILAPQGRDHAACRVFANKDNRFLYVPPKGGTEVAAFVQDQEAMRGLFANRLHYDNVQLKGYQEISSLGPGPATVAISKFNKEWNGNAMPMQAIAFGGYAQGLETIFECEARAEAWDAWYPTFMAMASSFDFPAKTAALKNGYYRDFMADGFVYFPVGNKQGLARY